LDLGTASNRGKELATEEGEGYEGAERDRVLGGAGRRRRRTDERVGFAGVGAVADDVVEHTAAD
jgi:hypothetical protein